MDYCETPIDLGNILTGRKTPVYLRGYNYDWVYRLCSIKANSDYTAFYLQCPMRGVLEVGRTLQEALDFIDTEHDT